MIYPTTEERACAELTKTLVAGVLGVPNDELSKSSRAAPAAAYARQVAMYLTHVVFAVNMTAVGRAFGRDRATVAHACRVIEAERENSEVDSLLERMSRALDVLTARPSSAHQMQEAASC